MGGGGQFWDLPCISTKIRVILPSQLQNATLNGLTEAPLFMPMGLLGPLSIWGRVQGDCPTEEILANEWFASLSAVEVSRGSLGMQNPLYIKMPHP